MTRKYIQRGRKGTSKTGQESDRPRPPGSDAPPSAPAPSVEEVVPPVVAGAGGVENIPEGLLSEEKQMEDELDHAGLDTKLPGEDRANAEEEHVDLPPT